jgi:type IV pilus assembly protein PilE
MAMTMLGPHATECQHSHMLLSDCCLAHPRERGFTLIELLITVVIVAVLASLAYPSFMGAIRKSRRSEAFDMVTRIQQAQERWRANNSAYTTDLSPAGLNVSTVADVATTEHGYYQVRVTVPPGAGAASGYTITATATGPQAADSRCATMAATMNASRVRYGPAGSEICWAQ